MGAMLKLRGSGRERAGEVYSFFGTESGERKGPETGATTKGPAPFCRIHTHNPKESNPNNHAEKQEPAPAEGSENHENLYVIHHSRDSAPFS